MVTVVDPAGTPNPVYTRSGATVETVVATGTTFGAAAQIASYSGVTIVIADCTSDTGTGVILPANADIGDVTEVYAIDYFARVYSPSGKSINDDPSPAFLQVGQSSGKRFRKVSATDWRTI